MPSNGLNKFVRESDDVFYTGNSLKTISTVDIDQITEIARKSDRRRARICAHQNKTDSLHNMLIALCNDTYVRPHKHIEKPETFHVVKGRMKIVIFEDGTIVIFAVQNCKARGIVRLKFTRQLVWG